MITFDPNESTTRILSEFILSDASRVFLHIIGRYDNETFEAYFDYDSDCKVLSYQILSSDEQVAKLTNLFYTISDSNMYNILYLSIEQFIDIIKVFNEFIFSQLFYYAEYYKKVYPLLHSNEY